MVSRVEIRMIDVEVTNREVAYKMVVEIPEMNLAYILKKTYSDFTALGRELENSVASALPTVPPSKFWGERNPSFIKQRQADLQTYIRSISKLPRARKSAAFSEFLMLATPK